MGLVKNIVHNNGINTSYHRISEINKNGLELAITVNSYVSEYYRDLEKEYYDMKKDEPNKMSRIAELSGVIELSSEEQSELDEINNWLEKYNKLSLMEFNFHAVTSIIHLELSGNETLSFAEIYERLKSEEGIFKDSDNI